jgi:hypothetical protein
VSAATTSSTSRRFPWTTVSMFEISLSAISCARVRSTARSGASMRGIVVPGSFSVR